MLKIFDILGREIQTLVDEYKKEGRYSITFKATDLSSGTYFYLMQVGNNFRSGKMLLMK